MPKESPQSPQELKRRRDDMLKELVDSVPYMKFLGIRMERRGDELTGVLPFSEMLIGNPFIKALHGGVTASFLEVTAIMELNWSMIWSRTESGEKQGEPAETAIRIPKTIDFTVDYLRQGLVRDAYARARIVRSGRRYASVHVEAWQDSRSRLFALATGHFILS